jgi:tyrosinase
VKKRSWIALASLLTLGSAGGCGAELPQPAAGLRERQVPATGLTPYAQWAQTRPLTLSMVTARRVRKNAAALTSTEKSTLVSALLELKKVENPWGLTNWKTGAPLSYYDAFVEWHVDLYRCGQNDGWANDEGMGGHMTPLVLPWHRPYLLLVENALRQAAQSSTLSLPYWKWDDLASESAIFSTNFLGGKGSATSKSVGGSFTATAWPVSVHSLNSQYTPSVLERYVGSHPNATTPPTTAGINSVFVPTNYDTVPYDIASDPAQSMRAALDGWRDPPPMGCIPNVPPASVGLMLALGQPTSASTNHVRGHAYVGGQWEATVNGSPQNVVGAMGSHASPNDPLFFLHHSFVDKLWWDWARANTVSLSTSGNGTIYRYRPLDNEPLYGADYGPSHVLWPFRDPSYRQVQPAYPVTSTTYADTTLPGITGSAASGSAYAGYTSTQLRVRDMLDNNALVVARTSSGAMLLASVEYQ